MTRINVVPVDELSDEHLKGEYHEILRPFGLVKKALINGLNKWNFAKKYPNQPNDYTLGTGHVVFFYDKLVFIGKRHQELFVEMTRRGYNPTPIDYVSLEMSLPQWVLNDYTPTENALKLNRQRIQDNINAKSGRLVDSGDPFI